MIFNEKYEKMSRDEMAKVQSERLLKTIERCKNVPFYKGKIPDDIRGVEDLHRLPFTHKTDLRDNYPYGLFTVPLEDVIRIQASSGTTGKPTVVGYTQNDLDVWGEVMARTIAGAGGDKTSIIQVGYGYGLFTGGMGANGGGEYIGATVIPVSAGNTARHVQIMQDFGPTMLACTPSYALYLAEALEKEGVIDKIKLKSGIFGAEPWTNEMRLEIEKRFKIKAYDIYGICEIIGPGVSFECECQSGLHINEDHFIPEIIDPNTLEVLPLGEQGELVFTTVTKEAIPLIRYRTRDITRLIPEQCSCGRTTIRMEKPCGRTDDMLIIRGVNVFPSQIESALVGVAQVEPHYLITVDRINNMDTLEVAVEVSESLFSDEVKKLESLSKMLTERIENILGIGVKIKLAEPRSIARSEGKAIRVIDKRKSCET